MNLQAVAAALPTEWVTDAEAMRRVGIVTTTPSWDLATLNSLLGQLWQQGLVERAPGDCLTRRTDVRRIAAPVPIQPTTDMQRGQVMFHAIGPVTHSPPFIETAGVPYL